MNAGHDRAAEALAGSRWSGRAVARPAPSGPTPTTDPTGPSPWARPAVPRPRAGRRAHPGTGSHPVTGGLPVGRPGPKPGIPAGAVSETVGTAGFTGPLAFTALDVAAAADGDRVAFAAIYDRYGPRLFDFCVGLLRDRDAAADAVQDTFCTAATRLGQLREPEKLRPWLYAIARHESLRRLRSRRHEQTVDEVPDRVSDDDGPDVIAARAELSWLVAEAAGGLSDRDRTVLELSYRHGLDGPELADALGVSHTNANTLVARVRTTVERSLGALLVARRARSRPGACAELDGVLDGWDGRFTVLMRKRIARHLDRCPTCESARRELVSPRALLGSAPVAVPAPFWLRDHVLTHAAPHLHGAAAATGGASWWPAAARTGLGVHGVHVAIAAPVVAALAVVPIVLAPLVSGGAEPVSVAAAAAPTAVAPGPPAAPRFTVETPSARRHPAAPPPSTRSAPPAAPAAPVVPSAPPSGSVGLPSVTPDPRTTAPGRPDVRLLPRLPASTPATPGSTTPAVPTRPGG